MRIAGFSLVELMVALGVVGILAAIAVPRYHSFVVQGRRSEAKTNLAHIAALQTSYKAEHGSYYYGAAMSGTNGIGYKDGLGNVGKCTDPADGSDEGLSNYLGFRPEHCPELRYLYRLRSASTAIASAASDGSKPIFPDCSGRGCWKCGYNSGDALQLKMSTGQPEVCRNITAFCPRGGGGCGGEPPVEPPPCACSCSWTLGTEQASSTDASLYECQERTSTLQREDNFACTKEPAGCVGGSPCAEATTRSVPYVVTVTGTKPIDAAAPTATNPCNCAGTPDPRPACSSGCSCSTVPASCPAAAPASITADLATNYACENVVLNIDVTTTCTPASTPPCTAPYVSQSTRQCSYAGTKAITCSNICGDWGSWSDWSECKLRSSGNYEEQRTRTKSCPNPCPNLPITDAHGNAAASCDSRDLQRRPCTPPAQTCVAGSTPVVYVGQAVGAASQNCVDSHGYGKFSKTVADNPNEFTCTCDTSTSCSPCSSDKIRYSTTADPCNCVNPIGALDHCSLSGLKLDDARQFIHGITPNGGACLVALDDDDVQAMQMVRGNQCDGINHQQAWEVFTNLTSLDSGCYNALIRHLLNKDPRHPLIQLPKYDDLFEATEYCTKHGADYEEFPNCQSP